MKKIIIVMLLAGLGAKAGAAPPALEEVLVTAQKRAQSLQDVPISVQALEGARIRDAGLQKIEDLSAYIPNFTMTETAIGNIVFIRGIGSGLNQGFEQSVGMFIDGLYAGRSHQFRAPFLDLERVEVLKGPQGTLFGKNTIAGAVNISTAKPGEEWEGRLSALAGDHGEREYTGVLSGPLSDTLGVRLAYQAREYEGHLDNTLLDRHEPAREEWAGRATLQWTPGDLLTVTATVEKGRFDVVGRAIQVSDVTGEFLLRQGISLGTLESQIGDVENGRVDDKKASRNIPGLVEGTDTENEVAILTLDWALGEHTLTVISGYSAYEFYELSDVDFTALPFLSIERFQDFKQWSQELRLASPADGRFDYIAGLYWQKQELYNTRYFDADVAEISLTVPPLPLLLPIPLPSVTTFREFDQDTETLAAFAQLTWKVTDALRLTGGLRWAREEKSGLQRLVVSDFRARDNSRSPLLEPIADLLFNARPHLYDEELSETELTPALTVQYDLNDDVMLYLRVAEGFKSGGFNEAESTGDISLYQFEAEDARSLEAGAKMRLLDGIAELNLNVFDTTYRNRQVSAFEGTTFIVGNAAESSTRGVEMDGRMALSQHLFFNLSLAYLESTFDEFANAACTAEQTLAVYRRAGGDCVQNLAGETTEFAPPWSASAGLAWRRPLGDTLLLRALLSANYSDGYFYAQDLDESEFQSAYTEYNLRLALADIDEQWELAVIGKNLTDETINSHGNDIPVYLGAHFVFTQRERSFALQASYQF